MPDGLHAGGEDAETETALEVRPLMGYRRRAGGGRRDANEPDILDAIAGCGGRYWQLGGTGNPDVLIWSPRPFVSVRPGFWLPIEVKTESGAFTENQEPDRFPVVRSVADVLTYMGVLRCTKLGA